MNKLKREFRREGVIIKTIDIIDKNLVASVLNRINHEITSLQAKYIVIEFQDALEPSDRKEIVDQIKKCFDVFIVLKSDNLNSEQDLEEYFFYGVHGLVLEAGTERYLEEQADILTFAAELFPRGWVFASTQNNKRIINKIFSLKIIPVPSQYDPKLVKFIRSHPCFGRIAPSLKSVPLLDHDPSDYSLTDKIRMKMILESINLRQKLMLKNVDMSFESSGL